MQPTLNVDELSIGISVSENQIKQITQDVSFSLTSGKTVALVGESGSGKSITALSLLNLLPEKTGVITHGKIVWHGAEGTIERIEGKEDNEENGENTKSCTTISLPEQPDAWNKLRGKGIAMVFQNALSGLNPVFTVGSQIKDVLKKHLPEKAHKSTIIQLFEEVKLPQPEQIYKRFPHQLSGGQLQRVMIAMALACEPSFLIADEPTTALDPSLQLDILALFKSIQAKRGIGILFITHDLHLISQFAHDIGVLYGGELVEYGSVDMVLKNPQNDYTRALLNSKPPIDRKISHLPTVEEHLNGNIAPEKIAEERQIRWEDMPVLEGRHLLKTYGVKREKIIAVNDVSLEVFENEVIGIVGESGSGKSTVAKMLCGMEKPNNGDVRYKRDTTLKYNNFARKKWAKNVQLIFQDPYSVLNPKQTIYDQVREVIRVHKTRKKSKEQHVFARELLKHVGLNDELFKKYPHELSGGQLQRVSIARALAVEPDVLICDESVSALDVSIQAHILNLLKRIKELYGLSLVFIAHDMGVVRYFCDRVMVIHNGKVVEEGKVSEVFDTPRHDYTRRLLKIAKDLG